MWSVGVICFILLSGISPFLGDDDAETMDNIMDVSWAFDHEHFDDVSEDAKDFISRLLVEEKSRLSAAQCLRHKWLSTPLTKQRRKALMSKKHLKNFMARMHWKASIAAVSAANWLRQQVGGTATTEDSAV
uniref:Protein kinase domain-containing protein n=1 Tax=Ciona savignyi TaxID=51511 RepID=H2Z5Z5_CIOSA